MVHKITFEKFFESKYPDVENFIRKTQGDGDYDKFLDNLTDLHDARGGEENDGEPIEGD